MNDKRNDFVCIGALHPDYVLQLKNNYFKNRTNPISHNKHLKICCDTFPSITR